MYMVVVVVQLLSRVQLFASPWTAARQASLFSTISRSLLRFISTESVMPCNHLILCCPLLLLPSIFPSISVFSNELALPIRVFWCFFWFVCFSFYSTKRQQKIMYIQAINFTLRCSLERNKSRYPFKNLYINGRSS